MLVLSQASLADQGTTATALGADRILCKAQCTPTILTSEINKLLGDAVSDNFPPGPSGG